MQTSWSSLPALLALGLAVQSVPASAQLLPADRATTWAPGVQGGIPVRNTVCATVNAATYGNGSAEASGGIQSAINACPAGQVVMLSAGTFRLNNLVIINKGITLRGAGPSLTTLQKTNGAIPGQDTAPEAEPIVVIGPNRYPKPDESSDVSLTADAVKGAFSVTVSSSAGFAAGQYAILDEDNYNTGAWTALPQRNNQPTSVQIWATDRVVWQRHNPTAPEDDPFPESLSWFSRTARPVNELKEIASVAGNTITFTTPIHIGYRTSHSAQLTRYAPADRQVKFAGLENVKVTGGSDGAVRFESAAFSWVRNIENTVWLGEGVAINDSFRCELRDSYIHDGAWPAPGGGGYAISIADESAEILIENNIIMKANKMMVARSAGTASVVGYNYAQDGFINYALDWQEVGINGSHMVGPHHILFEGNESFNYDSDNTHGSAIYHTIFRNHLTGRRLTFTGMGNARTAGLLYGSYWHSFVGNVLGNSGQTSGWIYNDPGNAGSDPWSGSPAIFRLGYDPIHWEQKVDPKVVQTTLRDGNFNYLTNQVLWDTTAQALPNSLYLTQKPPFFGTWTWPWVDPLGATKLFILPAKARFEGISAPPPEASIGDVTPVEGTGSNTTISVPITLSGATGQTVTIQYTTTALTATAGSDFIAATGTLTLPPGAVSASIPVTVVGDSVDEVDETFRVDLSAPSNVVLTDAQAVATIDDDDGPMIASPTVAVGEGDAGSAPATFNLGLSASSPQPVILSYATTDGTASAGSDYVAASGTVTFPPGVTTLPIPVTVNGDALDEPNETFNLELSGAVDGRLAADAVLGRILDDDGVVISIAELQHGAVLHEDLQPAGGEASPDLYVLRQPGRTSWEVVLDAGSGDIGNGQGPTLNRVGNDLATVIQTSSPVGTGPSRSLRWQNTSSTTAVSYVRVSSPACGTDCGPEDTYRLRTYDTTGYIARFNLFNGQNSVVVLQNATSRPVTGLVHFWNPAGTRLAVQSFSLNPRGTTTIICSTIGALANQSGAITVTSDAQFGGLVAKTVVIDPVVGFAFDAPMQLRVP